MWEIFREASTMLSSMSVMLVFGSASTLSLHKIAGRANVGLSFESFDWARLDSR